ncbi:hypothetical protein D0C37_21200 [Streptomyces koyangensis]|uniref:Uncharacterized protein n=1 Tax=Streptomyces koyangensis TaxID=188770 RepID=A0A385DFV8_9ACTN|nr:hypothetical protein D0C37_21200 [Streptomyces koyangensis]PKR46696.1 hypothetical protein CWE27_03775 [Streptomyces sp. EAG2]
MAVRKASTAFRHPRSAPSGAWSPYVPGRAGRAYRAGENLAPEGVERGRRSWEEFLAERVAAPAGSPVRPRG